MLESQPKVSLMWKEEAFENALNNVSLIEL